MKPAATLAAIALGFFSVPFARAGSDSAPDLFALAKSHFTKFKSPSEEAAFSIFFHNIQLGTKVDFTPNVESVSDQFAIRLLTDPVYADLWEDSRVVRAEWINWLCTDRDASKMVTSKGIEIDEARISGKIDLSWLKLEFPIRLFKCGLTDNIVLDRATVRGLQIQTTYFKGLQGDGLNVERDLSFADNSFAEDVVWLQQATIGGSLNCNSGQFMGNRGLAINLRFAKIGTTALLGDGFQARGEVSLLGASIGSFLKCDQGQFINTGGVALNLESANTGSLLLRHGFTAEGQVRLYRANISGNLESDGSIVNTTDKALDLEGAKTGSILLRYGFRAQGMVDIRQAAIDGTLECDQGEFINPDGIALDLDGTRVGSVLLRYSFRAEGTVSFQQATINGLLQCDGSHFITPAGTALNLTGARAQVVLLRNGFEAQGLVSLMEANIDGSVECDDGSFINSKKVALDMERAKTGSVFLRKGFESQGEVSLIEVTIEGSLDCDDSVLANAGSNTINATRAKIRGSVFLEAFKSDGSIDFQDAQIGDELRLSSGNWSADAALDLSSANAKTVLNDPSGWPSKNHLHLHGFTFDELHQNASLEAYDQRDWIWLQPSDTFRAQPFEQMAKVLRNMGREEAARDTMIIKNEDFGSHLGLKFPDVLWYHLLGPFTGYGYQPWNAFYWSLLFIFAGWIVFNAGYRSGLVTPTAKDAYRSPDPEAQESLSEHDLSKFYPRFSGFVYSLETFVPLLKLWMSDYWAPNATQRTDKLTIAFPWRTHQLKWTLPVTGPGLRIYLWVHVAAGWILTTLWVGGLTGLLKT